MLTRTSLKVKRKTPLKYFRIDWHLWWYFLKAVCSIIFKWLNNIACGNLIIAPKFIDLYGLQLNWFFRFLKIGAFRPRLLPWLMIFIGTILKFVNPGPWSLLKIKKTLHAITICKVRILLRLLIMLSRFSQLVPCSRYRFGFHFNRLLYSKDENKLLKEVKFFCYPIIL